MIHPKIDKVKTTGLVYLFQEPLHTILSTLFAKKWSTQINVASYTISHLQLGKKLISRKKAKSHYRKYFVIPVVEWNSISLIVLPTYYIYTCTDWFSLITSKFWGTHKTFVISKTVKSIQNTEQNAFLPHLHVNDKKKISTTVLN